MFSLFELVWKRIRLFFTDDEVFYIGGADVLPPPLEREQENRCLIALSGLHGDSEPMTREDARKQLIEHNLRLVVYLARKFENTGICVEDLISIGTIGLIKGINTFNPEKKIKLATYASRCIENEILMYLRRNNKVKLEVSIDEPLNVDWDGNELLLSDISEFAIPAGKVYLSPIVDCFDGMLPSWTIGSSPDAALVNKMLDKAVEQLNENDHPIIHSDRGCHYRWPGWIERMDNAGLERSMSKKGCSPDNSACEGLFGRIKNEMFYSRDWGDTSVQQFIEILDEYLILYNDKRIKESLGYMSPREYRQSLELVA